MPVAGAAAVGSGRRRLSSRPARRSDAGRPRHRRRTAAQAQPTGPQPVAAQAAADQSGGGPMLPEQTLPAAARVSQRSQQPAAPAVGGWTVAAGPAPCRVRRRCRPSQQASVRAIPGQSIPGHVICVAARAGRVGAAGAGRCSSAASSGAVPGTGVGRCTRGRPSAADGGPGRAARQSAGRAPSSESSRRDRRGQPRRTRDPGRLSPGSRAARGRRAPRRCRSGCPSGVPASTAARPDPRTAAGATATAGLPSAG